jgi:hypothetical protein
MDFIAECKLNIQPLIFVDCFPNLIYVLFSVVWTGINGPNGRMLSNSGDDDDPYAVLKGDLFNVNVLIIDMFCLEIIFFMCMQLSGSCLSPNLLDRLCRVQIVQLNGGSSCPLC